MNGRSVILVAVEERKPGAVEGESEAACGRRQRVSERKVDSRRPDLAQVRVEVLDVLDGAIGIPHDQVAVRLERGGPRSRITALENGSETDRAHRIVNGNAVVVHGDGQVRYDARLDHDSRSEDLRGLRPQVRVAAHVRQLLVAGIARAARRNAMARALVSQLR